MKLFPDFFPFFLFEAGWKQFYSGHSIYSLHIFKEFGEEYDALKNDNG